MMGSEAVAEVQMQLGFRTDKADLILAQLQRAQRRFEQRGVTYVSASGVVVVYWPWFLLSEMATFHTVVGEERVPFSVAPLVDDQLQEWEEGQLWRFDSTAT